MTYKEFASVWEKGQIPGCLCFEGTEEYSKEKSLSMLRERVLQGEFPETKYAENAAFFTGNFAPEIVGGNDEISF